MEKYCRKCGERLSPVNKFCPKCGTPVMDENNVKVAVKKKSKLPMILDTLLVVGALGVGGMFGWQYLNRQQENEPEVLSETQEPDTATTEPTATLEATAVAMSERYGAIIQSPEEL